MHNEFAKSNGGRRSPSFTSIYYPLPKEDVGKVIGKEGKQSKFIKDKSRVETFSILLNQEFTAWGRTWVNINVSGEKRAVEQAILLIQSTCQSYYETNLKTTRQQLQDALQRIQNLEEAYEDDADMNSNADISSTIDIIELEDLDSEPNTDGRIFDSYELRRDN